MQDDKSNNAKKFHKKNFFTQMTQMNILYSAREALYN